MVSQADPGRRTPGAVLPQDRPGPAAGPARRRARRSSLLALRLLRGRVGPLGHRPRHLRAHPQPVQAGVEPARRRPPGPHTTPATAPPAAFAARCPAPPGIAPPAPPPSPPSRLPPACSSAASRRSTSRFPAAITMDRCNRGTRPVEGVAARAQDRPYRPALRCLPPVHLPSRGRQRGRDRLKAPLRKAGQSDQGGSRCNRLELAAPRRRETP
jgi:hypothetical protein